MILFKFKSFIVYRKGEDKRALCLLIRLILEKNYFKFGNVHYIPPKMNGELAIKPVEMTKQHFIKLIDIYSKMFVFVFVSFRLHSQSINRCLNRDDYNCYA